MKPFTLFFLIIFKECLGFLSTNPTRPIQAIHPQKQYTKCARSAARVKSIEKYTRLPVWPAWNGVFIWIVQKIFGSDAAAVLENQITGRVGPNFFDYTETTPFIMLVHHCHSFFALDVLRWFQKSFFPEGFPAHPHRGFVTLTYFLDGAFIHRDSLGVRQIYGTKHPHHSQWLNTGAGVLHEEMFNNGSFFQRQELYQLWINLPASYKYEAPTTMLMGDNECPRIVTDTTETIVLAGSYESHASTAPIRSDLCVYHVILAPESSWQAQFPTTYTTLVVYIRQGSLLYGATKLPTHHTVFWEPDKDGQIELYAGPNGADILLLAGEPINEPCVAQGSMVLNSADEINRAYADYQLGYFGRPWKETLSDDEWKAHVQRYPSRYCAMSSTNDAAARTR